MGNETFYHALKINSEVCTGCTHCMNVCPTAAIRIKYGKATINEAACTDCGMCLKTCPRQAIYVEQDDFNQIFKFSYRIILLPSVFIGQFPEDISEEQIFSELHNLGFHYVMEVDKSTGLLMEETKHYLQQHPRQRPFISSFCPAVVRLIQVRFPSLIGHIVRLKQAMDIAAIYVRKKYIDKGIPEKEIGVFYVTQCAAKIAAIKCPVGEESSPVDGVINMDFIYNKILLSINRHKSQVLPRVPEQYHLTPQSIQWTLSGGEASNYPGRCLAIDEIHNVIDILEKLENDELTDIDFLELRHATIPVPEEHWRSTTVFSPSKITETDGELYQIQLHLHQQMPRYKDFLVRQMQLSGEIPPRSIEKLDEDLSIAFQKMEKITRIMKVLPQIDCGACGTPSCQALAQDVVQGKAKLNQCIFMQKILTREGLLTPEESMELSAKVWGIGKFEKNEE
ncbi:MAG: [Fe-Fe] hydrogenase large subunit C-terminal domain-containing protein [Odoribacter splanchnicus]